MPKPVDESRLLVNAFPEIAAQATQDVSGILQSSDRRILWKCELGHTWEASVGDRTRGRGCPYCSNKKVLPGYNDLATTHPELAKQAKFDATEVIPGSHKKLFWVCSNGHHWSATVVSRTRLGNGCPYCAGQRAIDGVSDLVTKYPHLAAQAQFDAKKFLPKSNKKVPWMCDLGHSWEASIASRTAGAGCPVCANKVIIAGVNDLQTTHPEIAKLARFDTQSVLASSSSVRMWNCQFGHIFESRISAMVSGAKCPDCSGKHLIAGSNDLQTLFPGIAAQAKFDPTTVKANSSSRMEWECSLGHRWLAKINERTRRGGGCPTCANYVLLEGFNDFATVYPHLVELADFDVRFVVSTHSKKLIWKCAEGHRYDSTIARILRGDRCSFCSGHRVLPGFNDLATTHPEIAKLGLFDATEFTAGSGVRADWTCRNGHMWSAPIASRVNKSHLFDGCAICSGQAVLPGFNDLATTHPEIAQEALFDTRQVTAGTRRKARWKCPQGHEYESRIVSRTRSERPSACPACAKTGFDQNADGYLYFLRHDAWGLYQIGITNVPKDRLKKHERAGWDLIELRGPMNGLAALNWETSILKMLRNQGADVGNRQIAGKFDGYTESWTCDSFEVVGLTNLMEFVDQIDFEYLGITGFES